MSSEYSKSPTCEQVPFCEHVCKSNLNIKSNRVSLRYPPNTIGYITLYSNRFIILFTQIINKKQSQKIKHFKSYSSLNSRVVQCIQRHNHIFENLQLESQYVGDLL